MSHFASTTAPMAAMRRPERRRRKAGWGILTAASVAVGLTGAFIADTPAQAAPHTCLGKRATIVGTRATDSLVGTAHADVIWAGPGDDYIDAKGGDDIICGGRGDDNVVAGKGSDAVAGGGGSDVILGGAGRDKLGGGADNDGLDGMAGKDLVSGGRGIDIAAFLAASGPVTADLAAGRATGGEGSDTIETVEALMGSDYADHLYGDAGVNALFSGRGADVLNGRGGADFVLLSNAPGPVEIDLGDDKYSGGGLARKIENVVGSPFDDTIYGDSAYNYLDGADGNDSVDGIDGSDSCQAETVVNCLVLPSYDADGPPGTPPPPAGTRSTTGLRIAHASSAARLDARRSSVFASAAVHQPAGGPVLRASDRLPRIGRILDAATVPSPSAWPATARSSTQYGYVMCPPFENEATMSTTLNGLGYFLSKHSLGMGGYTGVRASPWIYFTNSQFWVYYTQWLGPFTRQPGAGVWREYVGTGLYGYGWWWPSGGNQSLPLGSCLSQGWSF
ncbi:MAG: hypothetical protein QOK15_3537 [Nocardioidaceae bacterium]|jgi:Ca2+-binding RTX toxin-like protein|nr:hypothetical protein [Nocardioidaceae bacterium]